MPDRVLLSSINNPKSAALLAHRMESIIITVVAVSIYLSVLSLLPLRSLHISTRLDSIATTLPLHEYTIVKPRAWKFSK